MPNKFYVRGRAFEYRVKKDLESHGFGVLRSPGSKGIADLRAQKGESFLLIQCKKDGRLDFGEWNQLYGYAATLKATPILADMPGKQGIRYWRLLDRKVERGAKNPPKEIFEP